MKNKLYTPAEAELKLGVSKQTLRKWAERGFLEQVKTARNHTRYRLPHTSLILPPPAPLLSINSKVMLDEQIRTVIGLLLRPTGWFYYCAALGEYGGEWISEKDLMVTKNDLENN